MARDLKPPKTYEEQIDILENRGMDIANKEYAIAVLQNVNYYRFCGYCFQYLNVKDKYRKGVSFEHIYRLYEFDQKLRQLLRIPLEIAEIKTRTRIAYVLAHERGSGAHYDTENFDVAEYHEHFLKNLEDQKQKNQDNLFVLHHISEYAGLMPTWVMVEIISFTQLSKLYKNIIWPVRKKIADDIQVQDDYLTNWLHCFSVLRNTCSHYGRLYGVSLKPSIKLQPSLLRKHGDLVNDSLCAWLYALIRYIRDNKEAKMLVEHLADLVLDYESDLDLSFMGFPADWKELLEDACSK